VMPSFTDSVNLIYGLLPRTDAIVAPPVLFVLCGLPGAGKSHLARRLAQRLPSVIVSSDFVRKSLFPRPTYASEESAFIHQVSHAVTARLLLQSLRVIADATNLAEWHREKLYRIADETHAKLIVVHAVAPEAVIRARLSQRDAARNPHEFSEANWDVYELLKPQLEPVRAPHFTIDTSGDLEPALARILRAVG